MPQGISLKQKQPARRTHWEFFWLSSHTIEHIHFQICKRRYAPSYTFQSKRKYFCICLLKDQLEVIKNEKRRYNWYCASYSLLFCTLISENQGLEKLRSVSNLRKISGPVHQRQIHKSIYMHAMLLFRPFYVLDDFLHYTYRPPNSIRQ